MGILKQTDSPKNSKPNGCLIALTIIIALLVVLLIAMAALHLCPPQGPWPMPPWCGTGASGQNIQNMVKDYLTDNTNLGEIVGAAVPQGDPAYFQQIPTAMPAGQEAPLSFQVALPETTSDVYLDIQGQEYPLEAQSDYYYTLEGLTTTTGDELTFTINSGDLTTGEIRLTFTGDPLRVAANWTTTSSLSLPDTMNGHAIMDAGSNIPIITRTGSIASTMDAMRKGGAQWFAYDYYWAYTNPAAPEIVAESPVDPSAADEEVLAKMVQMAHESGLHYLLLTELEYIITPEERKQAGADASIDEWMAYDMKKWTEGQALLTEMSDKLQQNPDDPEVQAYWDRWFEQFGAFMQHAAQVAEANDVEALALGKQLVGAMVPENTARWQKLIADVRQVYHGQLTQALFTNQYSDWTQMPWLGDLDFLTIYYYSNLSDADHPTLNELTASFEDDNRTQFYALYEKFGKPLVFLNPFQSRDHAAQQAWFEPMASCPADVSQDWMAQADMYEAFLTASADEPWFGGMLTWGYWITPTFPAEYCFQDSSTVRGKPAELVIQRWFDLMQ